MSSNSFGNIFRLTSFGESHGKAIGGIIDGCPSGIPIDIVAVQLDLDRRKPGQSKITTQRKEADRVEILSGIFEGKTLGTPIAFQIVNSDPKPKDYSHIKDSYRPSHADYTYDVKYGIRDYRGGGRSSARETIARVVAGSIAKQVLQILEVETHAYVSAVGELHMQPFDNKVDFTLVDSTIVRCPDLDLASKMISHIDAIRKEGDTVGGVITGVALNVPVGLGAPVFDKLHADLAKAMMSINAVKGFEYGGGFDICTRRGSEVNDVFVADAKGVKTKTNFSGGIQGGISNGETIYFRVAFKPVATIMQDQISLNNKGEEVIVKGKGRHDPCVVPRAVAIVEAMTSMVILDHYLRNKSTKL
jgi:chorismate synthase